MLQGVFKRGFRKNWKTVGANGVYSGMGVEHDGFRSAFCVFLSSLFFSSYSRNDTDFWGSVVILLLLSLFRREDIWCVFCLFSRRDLGRFFGG